MDRQTKTSLAKEISKAYFYVTKQGARTDLTYHPAESKFLAAKVVGEKYNLSANAIYRYLRLVYLIQELQNMVDDGFLGLRAAVQLSYLDADSQTVIAQQIRQYGFSINEEQAKVLRTVGSFDILEEDFVRKVLTNEYEFTSNKNVINKLIKKAHLNFLDYSQLYEFLLNAVELKRSRK